MIVIVMGVSGSGKTSVGRALAQRLTLPFYDADDFHPQANIDKMKLGKPLDDNDRQPWLLHLAQQIQRWEKEGGAVLACSALKKKYRDTLSAIPNHQLKWVYLKGTFEVIASRLRKRKGHFFSGKLLQTQFDALEEPNNVILVNIEKSIHEVVDFVFTQLNNDD